MSYGMVMVKVSTGKTNVIGAFRHRNRRSLSRSLRPASHPWSFFSVTLLAPLAILTLSLRNAPQCQAQRLDLRYPFAQMGLWVSLKRLWIFRLLQLERPPLLQRRIMLHAWWLPRSWGLVSFDYYKYTRLMPQEQFEEERRTKHLL